MSYDGKDANHVDIAASLTCVGYVHERRQEMTKATEFYERALHMLLLLRGPESDETKNITERLELIYEQFNTGRKPSFKLSKTKSVKSTTVSPQRPTIWHKVKRSYFKCCVLT